MAPSLQYDSLTEAYCDAFSTLLAEVFAAGEPLARCLDISTEEICEVMTDLCQTTEFHRHSIIALYDGQLVAGLLAGDFLTPKPEEDHPVQALLKELSADFRQHHSLERGQCLSIMELACHPQHGGQGISQQLIKRALTQAAEHGFTQAIAEATGRVSQYLFKEKFGFAKLNEIAYRDFHWHGQMPFAASTEHPTIEFLHKTL